MFFVSLDDAMIFIAKLNEITGRQFRLPTEAEWEYAARGGRKSHGYIYAGSNDINKVAWYSGNNANYESPQPVALKAPNELGLYDMSGNLWEWCSDFYGGYTDSIHFNPTGPEHANEHVIRGSSIVGNSLSCRVSRRQAMNPSVRVLDHGLRLAL